MHRKVKEALAKEIEEQLLNTKEEKKEKADMSKTKKN